MAVGSLSCGKIRDTKITKRERDELTAQMPIVGLSTTGGSRFGSVLVVAIFSVKAASLQEEFDFPPP